MLPIPDNYSRLLQVRQSKNVLLKECMYVRPDIKLRNYQSIGVYHLIACPRMVLGDATGLGKTATTLEAFAYIKEKAPEYKLLVVASKSALFQWKTEVEKFLTGITAQVVSAKPVKLETGEKLTGGASRKWQLDQFFKSSHSVLIINYNTLKEEYESLAANLGTYMAVLDEASYFKNTKTLTYRAVQHVSFKGNRSVALTATIIKNRLEEAFAIYSAVVPGLFKNITQFRKSFCRTILLKMNGRRIPKVVGYKNLVQFRQDIDPYFLGRKKEDVAKELPILISKEVTLDMDEKQAVIYQDALDGLLKLDTGEEKKIERLTALIYCQQISNSPHTVGIAADSSKEEELFRLLDQDLVDEKVIIFTNFKKMIDRQEELFKEKKIKMTRITGDENAERREVNKQLFQDKDSGTNVIWINRAGSESINLQIASTFIFYDNPWSYGDYLQLVGRAQRIGSEHTSILVLHLVNRGTIDEYVLKTLKNKKGLVTSVFGETTTGELAFDEDIAGNIFSAMVQDANNGK